jgi:hypothetical protein
MVSKIFFFGFIWASGVAAEITRDESGNRQYGG